MIRIILLVIALCLGGCAEQTKDAKPSYEIEKAKFEQKVLKAKRAQEEFRMKQKVRT